MECGDPAPRGCGSSPTRGRPSYLRRQLRWRALFSAWRPSRRQVAALHGAGCWSPPMCVGRKGAPCGFGLNAGNVSHLWNVSCCAENGIGGRAWNSSCRMEQNARLARPTYQWRTALFSTVSQKIG